MRWTTVLIVIFFSTGVLNSLWAVPKKTTSKKKNPIVKKFRYIHAPFKRTYPIIPNVSFQALRKWKNPSLIWFWIHNDEFDARDNTYWAYQNLGGYALLLKNKSHKLNRNLVYYIRNKGRFYLDPNRMFHIKGIENNLRLLNKNFLQLKRTRPIISYTWNTIGKKSRSVLLRYWSKKRPLVAIHNNRYLSIKAFRNNPKNFRLAEFDTNPTSSFVFVTNKSHFDKLKACSINTIYQLKVQGDGSLSDFAIQHKLPYINVETKIGHKMEQRNILLKIAYSLFSKEMKGHPLLKENPCK